MKVILDEGVPSQVAKVLPDHEVTTVPSEGWAAVKNGKLLALIADAGFAAFLTCDKQMKSQQLFLDRPFAILILSCNHWPTMRPHLARIVEAVDKAQAGTVNLLDCGEFRKRRRPYVL